MGGVVQVLYNSNITDDKLEVQDLRFQDSMEATSLLQRSYLQSLAQDQMVTATIAMRCTKQVQRKAR
jgi:hypothetical protein